MVGISVLFDGLVGGKVSIGFIVAEIFCIIIFRPLYSEYSFCEQ